MPPDPRPFPKFVADSSQEGIPSGRFAERLAEVLQKTISSIDEIPAGVEDLEDIDWYPERAWGGRVWVPATARVESEDGPIEIFGHVSYVQPPTGDPVDIKAVSDFTDVFADDNPDWKIDLNDDVIGKWRGEQGMAGDITLIWGKPLLQGAVAATIQIETETVDQEPVSQGRFTLVAADALVGYGDDVFCEVKLWSRRANELASETLYDPPELDEPEVEEQDASESDPPRG